MSRALFDGIVSHLRETVTGVAHGTEGGRHRLELPSPSLRRDGIRTLS